MNNWYLLYAGLFCLLLYITLRLLERYVLPKIIKPDSLQEKKEADLNKQLVDLKAKFEQTDEKNRKLEANQELLLNQLAKATGKIERQEKEIGVLQEKVKELERTSPITPVETLPYTGRVLGIWPESVALDTHEEKNAIANTGLEYESLEGVRATRKDIVEQLSQRDYSIMEIGAKGGEGGIKLADEVVPPSWWARLAKQHNIDIFVVLANESSKPGVTNVADSLFNAGAKAVVSVDNVITDKDAIEFAQMLYRRLSRGVPLAKAVEYARLVISDAGSDTIKLREKK